VRVLAVAALLVVVAAGCGGSARPQRAAPHEIPRALARGWEGQASEIAAVASTGDSCRALELARSLHTEVVTSQPQVPLRLRAPLLTGVTSLADRITCTRATVPRKPPKPPKPPDKRHGHGHEHGGGDGNGGGNDQ